MGTKYQNKLMRELNKLKNQDVQYSTIGEVISPLPDLKISIWDGQTILDKDDLYMNDRLFPDHLREYSLEGQIGEVTLDATKLEVMGIKMPPKLPFVPHTPPMPPYTVQGADGSSLEGSGTYKATGKITNTDTLKEGDKVKLTPVDNGMWFIDYKVRAVGG